VSEYVKAFESTGRLEPDHKGSEKALNDEQSKELSDHLESKIYTKTKDIKAHIKETSLKDLSLSCIRDWLKNNDFTFKKPKIVPANTDPVAQQKFVQHS
jgi:transposase